MSISALAYEPKSSWRLLEAFVEALTQASRGYGRQGGISHKLLHNEFMTFNIGSFHRNASKPPNTRQKRGEMFGFSRFFNLEAYLGGSHERLHMPPNPIAEGKMDILDLVRADGIDPSRKTSKEYACRCSYCGGKDRFIIWPDQGDHGRWWCRQCGRRGDAIQYLRDVRKMRFQDACQYVGKEISLPPSLSLSGRRIRDSRRMPASHWVPRETTSPNDLWQERARRLIEESERFLFSSYSFAQRMLGWLKELRGLTEETIRAHRIGLVPIDRWEGHEQWGLEPVLKDDGTPKKIWIPRGLTIPLCQDGTVLRIRIRRLKVDGDPRYYLLRGSDTRALILGQDRDVFVVVESELDAKLLFQEVGDLVGIITLGNAQATPDKSIAEVLSRSCLILVSLDTDDAGVAAAWGWWDKHFPQAERWPPIDGKDPGEMLNAGVNLRDWIKAGLEEYSKEVAMPGGEEIEPHTPSQEDGITVMQETPPNSSSTENIVEEEGYSGQITPKPALTCYECGHFCPAVNSPNPGQALGYCEQKRKSRFGVARACEAILEPYPGVKNGGDHRPGWAPKV